MSQFEINRSQMNEQESLLRAVSTAIEIIQPQRDVIHHTSIFCRHCYKDSSAGKLIRPCRCTGFTEFIHSHCLEISISVWNNSHCILCNAPFPVEPRNKPLLEWCRNREALLRMLREIYGPFFKLLGLLLYNVILIIIISVIVVILDFSKPAQFIPLFSIIFVVLGGLLFPIFQEVLAIHNLFMRLYESCVYWKISNQKMKVIKGLPDISQEIVT